MNTITVKDESLTGKIIREFQMVVKKQQLSLRELIATRVEMEVNSYNKSLTSVYNGLVVPTKKESILNPLSPKKRPKIDAEREIYLALDGFLKNNYFVLVNDRQVDELDHVIEITPKSEVSFLRLTQLMGG